MSRGFGFWLEGRLKTLVLRGMSRLSVKDCLGDTVLQSLVQNIRQFLDKSSSSVTECSFADSKRICASSKGNECLPTANGLYHIARDNNISLQILPLLYSTS